MKIRCSYCSGSGYVKQKSEICDCCNGIKCIYCKSTGFKKELYCTCYKCFGTGETEETITNSVSNNPKDTIINATDK